MNAIGSIRQIDPHTVEFSFGIEGEAPTILQATSNVTLRANPTALIPAFLPVAARLGHDLHIEGLVDAKAAANATKIMNKLVEWDATLKNSRLVATKVEEGNTATNSGVGCLASLGLDSFYSMHTRHNDITHLVLCRGFDIGLNNEALWQQTVKRCRKVAATQGKELIEITTNIRDLADPLLSWTRQYHGAAIASFAHLLDEHISHIIIPSSFTNDKGMKWGSHSEIDPLWSSARLQFEHHELGVDRVQKMAAVANNASAMKYMRVCVEDLEMYNCGVCEKCIRTMCNAAAAGVSDKLQTLPQPTTDGIKKMPLRRHTAVQYHIENLEHLRELPEEKRRPDLEEAIANRLASYDPSTCPCCV